MIYNKETPLHNLNKFIVIDGINGSGKTTLIKRLKDFFIENKLAITLGKEPGGTEAGEKLREIVLTSSEKLEPTTQFFIMSASRAEYVKKVVLPAINNNSFFISDRYYYSSLAFQSYAGGLDFDFVLNVSKEITKNCLPDITFILDVDLETAFKRINKRNEKISQSDNFEKEKLEYHEKVRNGFLDLANKLSEQFFIIDASKDEDYIYNSAVSVLKEIYNI